MKIQFLKGNNRKNIVLFRMIIILNCTFLIFVQCTGDSQKEYNIEASYASTSPIIDGEIVEHVWQQAKQEVLRENNFKNNIIHEGSVTTIAACYNDTAVYFAFICNDPDIWSSYTQRDEYLWKEEAVEIFIDTDNDRETYVEIEVSPANIIFDSFITNPKNIDVPATALFDLPGIKSAVRINGTLNSSIDKDSNWVVEVAVPFKDLSIKNSVQVSSKTEIRINFFRLDRNHGMEPKSYAWSPTGGRFHNPAVFGRLIFN